MHARQNESWTLGSLLRRSGVSPPGPAAADRARRDCGGVSVRARAAVALAFFDGLALVRPDSLRVGVPHVPDGARAVVRRHGARRVWVRLRQRALGAPRTERPRQVHRAGTRRERGGVARHFPGASRRIAGRLLCDRAGCGGGVDVSAHVPARRTRRRGRPAVWPRHRVLSLSPAGARHRAGDAGRVDGDGAGRIGRRSCDARRHRCRVAEKPRHRTAGLAASRRAPGPALSPVQRPAVVRRLGVAARVDVGAVRGRELRRRPRAARRPADLGLRRNHSSGDS